MLAMVGHLGYIGDVHINGRARPAIGNDLYGSFGRDFTTADGRRVMIIALTPRQWRALGRATGLADRLAMVGTVMEVDLETESGRFEARDAIAALLARWCAAKTLTEIAAAFAGSGVLWGRFRILSGWCARIARLGEEPALCRNRAARDRPLSDARPAARFQRRAA